MVKKVKPRILQNSSPMVSSPKQARQQERAQRILDVTAELIMRWGYDKTSMDDIAESAGVAKGTLYLHWKTREELFEALLRRESLLLGQDFVQRLTAEPDGATLGTIYKQAAYALIQRPLLKAVLLGDRDVIGKLARNEQNRSFYAKRWSAFTVYLDFLKQHQLVRRDWSDQDLSYAVTSIFVGYFLSAPLLPPEMRPSDETTAELIGETIRLTIETDRVVSPEEQKQISEAFITFLTQAMQVGLDQLQMNL
jgi:AcrR family transcriptional regulator